MSVDKVIEYLETLDIFPYSVFFTYAISNGALSITFYVKEDLEKFLNTLNYNTLCDSSGFIVFEDNLTVILEKKALINFFVL